MSEASSSIKQASKWTVGAHIVVQLLKFCSNLVLTRILAQDAFGLIAVANVIMYGFALLSDTGVFQILITSKRAEDPVFRGTAWSVQIIRGGLIGAVAILAAALMHVSATYIPGLLNGTYADERLPMILAVLGLSPLIQGFKPTKYVFALRDLKIKEVTVAALLAQVMGSVVTITLSFLYENVWALAIGAIAASIFDVLLCHLMLPGPRDHFVLDRTSLSDMLHVSKWIMLTSATGFFVSGGDRLILAGLLDSPSLGQYAIAFMLVSVAIGLQEKLMGSVAFPALSAAARIDAPSLAVAYQKFQRMTDGLVCFGAAFGAAAGQSLVHLLYGGKYAETTWMFCLLSAGMVSTRFQPAEQCYISCGKAHYTVLKNLLVIGALYVAIQVGYQMDGLRGAVWGVVIGQFASWPVAIYFLRQQGIAVLASSVFALPAALAGLIVGLGVDRLLSMMPRLV